MQRTALIVAGGSGSRMGVNTPKQFLPLAGKPVLVHTVRLFLRIPNLSLVVLVLPNAHINHWLTIAQEHLTEEERVRVQVCPGGSTRTDSVQAGLETMAELVESTSDTLVAIHDGVRPLISRTVIQQSYELAVQIGASVVCVPVKASLRKTSESGSRAIDRSQFWEVQTPQTFRLKAILNCYRRRPEMTFSDDASLYEEFGGKVAICPGSYDNLKLTTPEDLLIAEQILENR